MKAETTVRKLDFTLTPEIERGVYAAKEKFDNTVKGMDIAELKVETYGKDYIKTKKLSPDAVMQLAFQVRQVSLFYSCWRLSGRYTFRENVKPWRIFVNFLMISNFENTKS